MTHRSQLAVTKLALSTSAALMILMTYAAQSQALGLGEAEVHSTLDAPLRATVPLTDSAGIQADLLNVSVADERAFTAAGLSRTPLAASVRLAVEQRQGRLVVDLTTERAVREPWLDLLLRFDWPGGQQLRELTLLLDPPDYEQMPALVRGSRRAASARVRSGDTLWAVAGRLRPDGDISMNQMMVALVEANPEAFTAGNINAMRAGATLVVPSRETIAARSSAEAERLVREMHRAWASRESAASVVDEPAAEAPRLTLLTDAQVAAEGEVGRGAEEAVGDLEGGVGDLEGGVGDLEGGVGDPEGGGGNAEESDLESGDERLVRLEARWRESRQALEAVQEERDGLQNDLGELRQQLQALQEQLAALAAGGAGEDGPGAGGIASPGGEAEETPRWGSVYRGEVNRHLVLSGAGLAALLALWRVVRRRRRQEEGGDRPPVPSQAPSAPGIAPAPAAASAGAGFTAAPSTAPESGAPEPGAPEPGAPEPGAPEPGAPEPGAPEPGAPEPYATEQHASESRSAEPEVSPLPQIIDYRPPRLEDEPAPRKETPMQPSVEFTPPRPAEAPAVLPQGWEVEEVSFPPLDPDNVETSSSDATERLAEARRLIDAGEAEQARTLLGRLMLSEEPAIHDAAAALLTRLDT